MPQTIFHSQKNQTAKKAAPLTSPLNPMGGLRPKIIKKYGNRKLYDTEQSAYVVLKDIEKMIRNNENIQVIDNETQSDITAVTLTQIIFGAEKKSNISTPLDVLKSIITEGDGGFSSFLAKIGVFQAQFPSQSGQSLGGSRSRYKPARIRERKNSMKAAGKGAAPELPGMGRSSLSSSMREGKNPSLNEELIPQLPGAPFND